MYRPHHFMDLPFSQQILLVLGAPIILGACLVGAFPLPGDRYRARRWLNRQRSKVGLEPVAGIPLGALGDSNGCVMANGLKGPGSGGSSVGWFFSEFGKATYSYSGHQHSVWNPRYVRSVIFWFDLGFRRSLDEEMHPDKPKVVLASSVMTRKEKKEQQKQIKIENQKILLEEQAQRDEEEIKHLEERIEKLENIQLGTESSITAIAKELRDRIRDLEKKEKERAELYSNLTY